MLINFQEWTQAVSGYHNFVLFLYSITLAVGLSLCILATLRLISNGWNSISVLAPYAIAAALFVLSIWLNEVPLAPAQRFDASIQPFETYLSEKADALGIADHVTFLSRDDYVSDLQIPSDGCYLVNCETDGQNVTAMLVIEGTNALFITP